MGRPLRVYVPGVPLHVLQRGNNRADIFFADEDRRRYLEYLTEASRRFNSQIHAYVLMDNHIHLLATPNSAESLGQTLKSLNRRYAAHINRRHDRTGSLWETRYRANLVDSERYLMACYRYIEFNPMRAGITSSPGEYNWSSYGQNAMGLSGEMTASPHPLYLAMGDSDGSRQRAYRNFCEQRPDPAQDELISACLNGEYALGGEHFRNWIAGLTGQSAGPRRRGRPPIDAARP